MKSRARCVLSQTPTPSPYLTLSHKQNTKDTHVHTHTHVALPQRTGHGGLVKLSPRCCTLTWHHMTSEPFGIWHLKSHAVPMRSLERFIKYERKWENPGRYSSSGKTGVKSSSVSLPSQFNRLVRLEFFSSFQARSTKKAQHRKTSRVCCQTEL